MNYLFQYAFLLLLSCLAATTLLAQQNPAPPTVILKLDDLKYQENGTVHPGWQEVFDYLNERGVTATIGVIASSLEEGDQAYFDWINTQRARGHEIWHHGYCHCKPLDEHGKEMREFQGTGYAYQVEHLRRAQALAVAKLGEAFRSFGAPHNATDSLTALAMQQLPELKVWMYKGTDSPTDKYVLSQTPGVNIEYPVHVPDFERFRAGYLANRTAPVLVIQGHPQSWHGAAERLAAFKQIIEFLLTEGAEFATPYAYYLANK